MAKIIDLNKYRKQKEEEKFNQSRDKLIADLDRSGIMFDNITPLPEQIDNRRILDLQEIMSILGIEIKPI